MLNVSINDALDPTASILKYISPKDPLEHSVSNYKQFREDLLELLRKRFNGHTEIYELISLNTCIIDALLKNIWATFQIPVEAAALVAIGGYGRRELFPESDIDLMIILNTKTNDEVKAKVEAFLTFLWDINLPIAQSVRTLKDCLNEAKYDITVMTSLMELYYLSGSKDLYEQLINITTSSKLWPSKKFFKEKVIELENRHHKYGDTANHLEPNVKENPGGLRDVHTLRWLTNRHFKTECFEDLGPKEFLSNREIKLLQESYRILAKIRFALHLHTQRSEDRLLFDYQYDVASLLGYKNDNRNYQVEEFMQVFYRTSNRLSTLSEIIINRLRATIFPGLLRRRAKVISDSFQIRGTQLEAIRPSIFKEKPAAILELFQLLQLHQNLTGPSNELIQLLLDHLYLIDDQFRRDSDNCNLFISILSQAKTNTREIRRMAKLGVLGKYWPSFDAVTGRMQFDLYHVYTVEEHTLRVFENACNFSTAGNTPEDEAYHDIFTQTPKALVLYLAALFHDIAKGREGDHSELGVEDVEQFCAQHQLSPFDTNLISWLVKNHLVMSITSQHKDINDPDVIKEFAENVGNLTRLNYLYLLTIADISGTNPKLWNHWRSALLTQCYESTSRYIRRGLDSPIKREELMNEVIESALQSLQKSGIEKQACLNLWQELDEDYFLRHSDEEVMRQTQAVLDQNNTGVIVNIHQFSTRGATEIFIYCRDRNYLFAQITATLSRLGLSIVHARVITSDKGNAFDTFLVLDSNNEPIDDAEQCTLVAESIKKAIENPSEDYSTSKLTLPRRVRELRVPVGIEFTTNSSRNYTMMEITAPDFPGLLASIGSAFVDCSIAVHDARISTLGERVHNIFEISTLDYKPLEEAHREKLEQNIKTNLEQPKQIQLAV